ncbi:hypothetical protein BJV85_000082 [Clostridium acetobutylicum]|nr:hypothetical protein CEA_G0074 [Clostridium acetobutylicum EA 2018]AEI31053.1 hypothetical protein SMB_G0075 [Clostridium acetobutylicum DSM 1731]NOV87111.1 hypothetical protein [Clostridium acetobutylicum]NOW14543.1 hypothetical protein [Clostridium acetobutylicum]NRY58558.1 hypothetical protein [Clostridium acetobutylicum]
MLERILLAISISGVSGCDIALLYNSVEEKDSEKAFSLYNSFSVVGYLIATVMSTFIIKISMDLLVLATIFPYGISVIVALFLKDVTCEKRGKESIKRVLMFVIKSPQILIFLISVALESEVCHSITVFLNQLQYKRVNIDIKYYGLILVVIQIVSMISSQAYKLTRKFGKGKTLTFMLFSIAISCIFLVEIKSAFFSILLIVIISFSESIILPVATEIESKSVSLGNRATVLSAYAVIIDIISAVVNLVIGKAANHSLRIAFFMCGILVILAVGLNIIYFTMIKILDVKLEAVLITYLTSFCIHWNMYDIH